MRNDKVFPIRVETLQPFSIESVLVHTISGAMCNLEGAIMKFWGLGSTFFYRLTAWKIYEQHNFTYLYFLHIS